MKIKIISWRRFAFTVVTLLMGTGLLTDNTANAQEAKSVASPDKFMIRLGSYYVTRADTDITVLTSGGIGTTVSFSRDLGGETTDSVPRIDGYYRFNDRHRLEIGSFTVDRDGVTTTSVTIGDEILTGTITSNIEYTTTKIGYAY